MGSHSNSRKEGMHSSTGMPTNCRQSKLAFIDLFYSYTPTHKYSKAVNTSWPHNVNVC